jgi:hypothetical protein
MIFWSEQGRQSNGQLATCSAVLVASSFAVMMALELAWRSRPFVAVCWTALYISGGFRWFPRGTPLRKAVSAGVLIGTLLPTAEWIYRLSH